MGIQELLTIATEAGASDLHLKVGSCPMMRIHGSLDPIPNTERLTSAHTAAFAEEVIPKPYRRKFEQYRDLDFSYSLPGRGRFRCNIFQQRGSIGLVLRIIHMDIRSFDSLNLPLVVRDISMIERGMVLVTGTTTSGKSTTIAAMLDHINHSRRCHIVTIEDPIEYLHRDDKAIINQREVEVDTVSFAQALRSALRQDPDVILVGEMRDTETIETALLAAETGHLVYSTLHTLDATETINRIVGAFPPHHQRQVRLQLAGVLKATLSMRLLRRADGDGLVPAVEAMVVTPFIRECIIDADRTSLIPDAIATGRHPYGMQTFDQSIFGLLRSNLVNYEEALRNVSNIEDFKLMVQGVRGASANAEPAGAVEAADPPELIRFGR